AAQHLPSALAGGADLAALDERVAGAEDDETQRLVVADVLCGGRRNVDCGEVPTVPGRHLESADDVFVHLVKALGPELLGLLLGLTDDALASVEPVAGTLDVEVRRLVGQALECVAVGLDGLAGERTCEPDPLGLDALVRRLERR